MRTEVHNVKDRSHYFLKNRHRKYFSLLSDIMAKLWSFMLLVLGSLCAVQMSPLEDEKHRALIRAGYEHIPHNGYYR